jgi:hypothetical protein
VTESRNNSGVNAHKNNPPRGKKQKTNAPRALIDCVEKADSVGSLQLVGACRGHEFIEKSKTPSIALGTTTPSSDG